MLFVWRAEGAVSGTRSASVFRNIFLATRRRSWPCCAHARRSQHPRPNHPARPLAGEHRQARQSRPPARPRPQAHRLRQGTRHHGPGSAASPTAPPAPRPCFGTRDIALILSRIAVALLRADALEARLLRSAARPDPKPGRRARHRSAHRTPRAREAAPAASPIRAWRACPRRSRSPPKSAAGRSAPCWSISAAISASWRTIRCGGNCILAIILHGGDLAAFFKDMCERAFASWRQPTSALDAPPASSPPLSLEPASTGPP